MKEHNISAEELRGMQRICLEMMLEVDRICRKNGIKYSVDGGTLLGAVRHEGFIPWDDDGDIIFTRSEYERFRDACREDLDEERFFLQDYTTDTNYRWGYAKMRRQGTVLERPGQEHLKQHTGIFLDIFIVDNVPDGGIMREVHYWCCFCIRKLQYAPVGAVNEKNVLLRLWYILLKFVPRKVPFFFRDVLAAICNNRRTELVSHYTFPYPDCCANKYGMPAVCFDEYVDLKFEGYKLRGFAKYDLYLSHLYGDYMTLPPVDKRVSHMTYSELKLVDTEARLQGDV